MIDENRSLEQAMLGKEGIISRANTECMLLVGSRDRPYWNSQRKPHHDIVKKPTRHHRNGSRREVIYVHSWPFQDTLMFSLRCNEERKQTEGEQISRYICRSKT